MRDHARTAARVRGALAPWIAAALGFAAPAQGIVDCSGATTCSQRGRDQCNPLGLIPNACGDCFLGTFGGQGPTNAYCLSNRSCAAIYPGMEECPLPGSEGIYRRPQLPLVLPFGQCICDSGDGLRWPTAPGSCARVTMAAEGNGYFSLERCSSATCEPETCSLLTTWAPISDSAELSFACRQAGADSAILVDDCSAVVGQTPDSAFCGHPGLVDSPLNAGEFIIRCELAPRCPSSVMLNNLEQSCCLGNDQSFLADGTIAPGFCYTPPISGSLIGKPVFVEVLSARGLYDADPQLQGDSDPFCEGGLVGKPGTKFETRVVDDSQEPVFNAEYILASGPEASDVFEFRCWDRDFGKANDLLGEALAPAALWEAEGFDGELRLNRSSGAEAFLRVRISLLGASDPNDCTVRTLAPGWQGCACLAKTGFPRDQRVCTAACTRPDCGTDGSLIPPTPDEWRTSDIPVAYYGQPRSVRVSSSGVRARAALAALASCAAALASARWRP